MTDLVRNLYDSAIKNDEFIKAAKEADGDSKPGLFASQNEKIVYATIYYGWLVGKYGNNWRNQL